MIKCMINWHTFTAYVKILLKSIVNQLGKYPYQNPRFKKKIPRICRLAACQNDSDGVLTALFVALLFRFSLYL